MKADKLIISLLLSLFVFLFSVTAQTRIAVLSYMKTNPAFEGDYLEVEKAWKKVHEARQASGKLHSWYLYRVMFTGQESPYDYVTVNVYSEIGKLENAFTQEDMDKAYPDYDDAKWEKFMKSTENSRSLLKDEVYFRRLWSDTANRANFIVVNRMKVKVTGFEYATMENDVYKPLHNESVKMGLRSGWSVWNKWPGDYTDFNFVTVDAYKSLSQMTSNNQPLFKSIHPDKDPFEVQKETDRIRDWISAEIWEHVDSVLPLETDQ